MNPLVWCLEGLWVSGLCKILLRSAPSIECMEGCSYSGGRPLYAKGHTDHLRLAESTFSPNADTATCPPGASFKVFTLLTLGRVVSEVSEGFEETIVLITDDPKSPALDTMTASHFALASSHSPRGIALCDIILGLKLLKKQNSPLGFLAAFNFIFSHQRKSGTSSVR